MEFVAVDHIFPEWDIWAGEARFGAKNMKKTRLSWVLHYSVAPWWVQSAAWLRGIAGYPLVIGVRLRRHGSF